MTYLYLLLFYWQFAGAISVYRLWLKGSLNLYNKVIFGPALIIFFIVDVALNYTIIAGYFGFPKDKQYTISQRFEAFRAGPDCMEKTIANFVCDKLLNPIDPSGRHC